MRIDNDGSRGLGYAGVGAANTTRCPMSSYNSRATPVALVPLRKGAT
jgi:hypothetical protein